MAKVRCVAIDCTTSSGYMPGMLFEAEPHPTEKGWFIRGKLLWAHKRDIKKMNIPEHTQKCQLMAICGNSNSWSNPNGKTVWQCSRCLS